MSRPVTATQTSREAHELLQRRLALVGRVAFSLTFAFWLVQNTVALSRPEFHLIAAFTGGNAYSLAAAGIMALLWLVTRGRRLSPRLLAAVDVGAMGAIVAVLSVGMTLSPASVRADLAAAPQLAASLVANTLMMFRAAMVPCTPRRTLVAGAVMSVPPIAVAALADSPGIPALKITYVVLWMLLGTTIATITSQALYGLRQSVREAKRLGQYVLRRKLGEGGFGEVYEAEHAMLRRPTALKLILPDRVDEAHVARFEREVRLTATLTHPNTVTIFDYGRTADGVFYYAMELLDGVDLQRLVEGSGPQPPGRVASILGQVAGSLAEAHAVGLVHRDIKPANLVLCRRPEQGELVKVVDFGLAKDMRADDPGLSRANAILGTPHYLAPETVKGEPIGPHTDLYALGGVAYFLLTGVTPFEGGTVVEVCAAHLHETPARPSARLGQPLPEALEDLVMACLEKDPARRPTSARALGRALAACAIPPLSDEEVEALWAVELPPRETAPTIRQRMGVSLAGRPTFTPPVPDASGAPEESLAKTRADLPVDIANRG